MKIDLKLFEKIFWKFNILQFSTLKTEETWEEPETTIL